MAEMNLNQIVDKLNKEFVGDIRKLVFWYDSNGDFKEDIENVQLDNAKVLILKSNNQFYVKHFLEYEDTTTSYLIYAPFAKPDISENHLLDMMLYSKEFFADRASLISSDLKIKDKYKNVIEKHIKFFASKDRTQRFYDLEIDKYNKGIIEVALMSVICKSKTSSIEEVLRIVLTESTLDNNIYLKEFAKYDLIDAFWEQMNDNFGFNMEEPNLQKLVMMLYITYAAKTIKENIPTSLKGYVSLKWGTVVSFLDNLMNNYLYRQKYDELAAYVYDSAKLNSILNKLNVDAIAECNVFDGIDSAIIDWMIDRLLNEDIIAKIADKTIPEMCNIRRKLHFGKNYENDYRVIENAFYIIDNAKYINSSDLISLSKKYVNEWYKIDKRYRYFYYHLDKIEDNTKYEKLKTLIENIYTNDYLNKITVNWNDLFNKCNGETGLIKQTSFYKSYVGNSSDRVAVIISDAFRYEVASSLVDALNLDEKCTTEFDCIQGVVPSYTPLGMGALLPHRNIEYDDKYNVLIDGNICATTAQREQQLRQYKPNGRCVQFDDIKNMKQDELRKIFTGQEVVYIYHNQIDARGDNAKTENEVFVACEEAVKEIHEFMRKISSTANTHHFIVTADHGFIYKRDKLSQCDKISGIKGEQGHIGLRYYLDQKPVKEDGVCSYPLNAVLGNNDTRYVSYPLASNIFKTAGAGQNYVHGGSSPQECLIPLINVKIDRYKNETSLAQISLISLTNKITNLIVNLDFVQNEAVDDVVKKTEYKIHFIDEDGNLISNENIYIADKKDKDTADRVFKLRFSFKNMKYDSSKKYYLVINDINGIEAFRREMIMDIAFADDFGFFK